MEGGPECHPVFQINTQGGTNQIVIFLSQAAQMKAGPEFCFLPGPFGVRAPLKP